MLQNQNNHNLFEYFDHCSAAERKENNSTGFHLCDLEARTRMWSRLSYMASNFCPDCLVCAAIARQRTGWGYAVERPRCRASSAHTPVRCRANSAHIQGLWILGGVPREQKMLMGHLLRVIYHQVYQYSEIIEHPPRHRPAPRLSKTFNSSKTSPRRLGPSERPHIRLRGLRDNNPSVV